MSLSAENEVELNSHRAPTDDFRRIMSPRHAVFLRIRISILARDFCSANFYIFHRAKVPELKMLPFYVALLVLSQNHVWEEDYDFTPLCLRKCHFLRL